MLIILQLYYKWISNIDIKEKYGYTKYIKEQKKTGTTNHKYVM